MSRDPDVDPERPPLRRWMQAIAMAVFVAAAAGGVVLGAHLESGPSAGAVAAGEQPRPGETVPASPSPAPSATPAATPTAATVPPPVFSSVPGPGRCGPQVYVEVDREAGGSLDIHAALEGVCPLSTSTTSLTVYDDAGTPVAATGNPATSSYRCTTSCMPLGPGQGAGIASFAIRPYVWSNWCGGPGLFHVTVRMTQNGVPASSTVVIAQPPSCVAHGQPSRLVAPPA